MKDDNMWLLILLAAGAALYFVMKSRTAAAIPAAASPAGNVVVTTAQTSNPLAGTNLNPAIAPATQNVVASAAAAQHQGAAASSSSPFSYGPSATVVGPDIWSTDASDPTGSSGGRYQPGHGPALIL